MFRKFIKILLNVTKDYQQNDNLRDFILKKKGLFIDQLNKRYFDLGNTDCDISQTSSGQ